MPKGVLIAVAAIVLAMVLYTVGVWAQFAAKRLRTSHVALFWLGFLVDLAATVQMYRLVGRMELNAHSVTGVLGLVLMLGHAVAATAMLARHDEHWLSRFYRVSVGIWVLWMVPFIWGAMLQMPR